MLEDDTTLGRGIQLALQGPDVTIALTGTLSQAREMLAQKKFDLLILDVNLPDGSALDLLREVRQGEAVPVILLTANDLEMDVVTGLESGADDYITKPFSLAILRARVNAQLRRRVKFSCVELDGFRFDFERMAFWKNGEPIELSKTEQKLLQNTFQQYLCIFIKIMCLFCVTHYILTSVLCNLMHRKYNTPLCFWQLYMKLKCFAIT